LESAIWSSLGPRTTNDDSVGLGGLPNEEGIVELDACCMHGRRGAQGRWVRAQHQERLQGCEGRDGAYRARHAGRGGRRTVRVAMGFPRENLLTERSRKVWLLWKEYHSSGDWWDGLADPNGKRRFETGQTQADLWRERILELADRAATSGLSRASAGLPCIGC